MKPALNDNLMDRICASENVRTAWKRVESNGGSAGADGMSIDTFLEYSKTHWSHIRKSLLDGTYRTKPVLRVEIPKRNGGTRPLGIPIVCDRLIQQSILQVLTPIFDPEFSESSFGFRPRRSAHGAIRRVRELVEAGYHWVVDIDVEKFFDTVNHDKLMSLIGKKVRDKKLLKLIGRYLRAGVEVNRTVQPTVMGTPQGGPLSPLLANIYLDVLDKELEKRGLNFVRYADDVLIFVKSHVAGERVMASITRFIEKRLKLAVNREKSAVRKFDRTHYLGFRFKGNKKTRIYWSDDAYQNFKYQIKRLTGRSWFVSMSYRLKKLARYIRGWMQYYGISEYYRPVPLLDEWLRRRVRMCYLKQWRLKRTRMNKLISLGVDRQTAKRFAFIDRGWWYRSGLLAPQVGMTNKWLFEKGLVSIKDIWVKIHYPDTPKLSFALLK